MFIDDLKQEYALLRQIQDHHIQKLYAHQSPSGILLYQKQAKSYRWVKRDLLNGSIFNVPVKKSNVVLLQNLAVNLYRYVCIQHIQNQLESLEILIRSYQSGKSLSNNKLSKKNQKDSGNMLGGSAPEVPTYSEEIGQSYTFADIPIRQLLLKIRNYPRTPADFFCSQSPYRPLILAYLQNEYAEIIEWYLKDFQHNEEHPEKLVFPVKLGFKVRSKSEVLIADRLFEEGILFHYEELLALSGTDAFPDFLTMFSVYEKKIWEHFGAMDNEYYFNRARGKILAYLDSKWFPGINMIATFETKQFPLTEENVDQKIRWLKNRCRLAFADLPPDESFTMYDLAESVKLQNPNY